MSLLSWLFVNYNAEEEQIFQQWYAITSIYQKSIETGSVGDRAHTGRPSTIIDDKVQEFVDNEPAKSVRSVARDANDISRYQAH